MVKVYFILRCLKTDIIFAQGVVMGTLEKQIERYKEEFKQRVSSETLQTIEDVISDLKEARKDHKSLNIGDKIPEFTLQNSSSKIINIKPIIEKNNYTVFSFFEGSWSTYCNLALQALNKIISQLKIFHAEIYALSPQNQIISNKSIQEHDLKFDILHDKNNCIAKEFGISYTIDERLKSIYENIEIDISRDDKKGTFDLPLPAVFVVNKNYEIIFKFCDEDYRHRCDPSDIMQAIKKDIINNK